MEWTLRRAIWPPYGKVDRFDEQVEKNLEL